MIYPRGTLAVPYEDVRVSPSKKLTWEQLLETSKPMLQAYQVTVSKILSRLTGTDFSTLRRILFYDWGFDSSVVEDLIRFITTHETKEIEFEEIGEVRKDVIFLKPRIRLSIPIAEHSIWISRHEKSKRNHSSGKKDRLSFSLSY